MVEESGRQRRRRRPRAATEPAAGGNRGRRDSREHRDLAGAGPSQVGVEGALRARDVNRPTAEDLAEAERDVVLVRRHWTPRE